MGKNCRLRKEVLKTRSEKAMSLVTIFKEEDQEPIQ